MKTKIEQILKQYQNSFSSKHYSSENEDSDVLMNIYGITPSQKRENRQYWGRELGMIWEKIVIAVFEINHPKYTEAKKFGQDEPYDLQVEDDVIDLKYRIGSGDSGTLKKFKQYGAQLRKLGFNPIILVLRKDNLPAAISACQSGGWTVLSGEDSFAYIFSKTTIDLQKILEEHAGKFNINSHSY